MATKYCDTYKIRFKAQENQFVIYQRVQYGRRAIWALQRYLSLDEGLDFFVGAKTRGWKLNFEFDFDVYADMGLLLFENCGIILG